MLFYFQKCAHIICSIVNMQGWLVKGTEAKQCVSYPQCVCALPTFLGILILIGCQSSAHRLLLIRYITYYCCTGVRLPVSSLASVFANPQFQYMVKPQFLAVHLISFIYIFSLITRHILILFSLAKPRRFISSIHMPSTAEECPDPCAYLKTQKFSFSVVFDRCDNFSL